MNAINFRQAKTDRRSSAGQNGGKPPYTGPERRSGNERRVWIDRMQETRHLTRIDE